MLKLLTGKRSNSDHKVVTLSLAGPSVRPSIQQDDEHAASSVVAC